MSDSDNKGGPNRRRLDMARELEDRGHVDHAVKAYMKAGAPAEAARLLLAHDRYLDAGQVMLDTLGISVDEASALSADSDKAVAKKAAMCFEHGGAFEIAAALLRGIGDREEAVRVVQRHRTKSSGAQSSGPKGPPATLQSVPGLGGPLLGRQRRATVDEKPRSAIQRPGGIPVPEDQRNTVEPNREDHPEHRTSRSAGWKAEGKRSQAHDDMIRDLIAQGRKGAAARVAWEAGLHRQAARWFIEVEQYLEAGLCMSEMGALPQAHAALLRVSPDHPKYRIGCARLIELSTTLEHFDFDVDRAVTPFVQSGPETDEEVPLYLTLARLYRERGFADGAIRVLTRVLEFAPDHPEASAIAAALQQARRPEKPRSESRRQRLSSGSLPGLPALDAFVQKARTSTPIPPPNTARARGAADLLDDAPKRPTWRPAAKAENTARIVTPASDGPVGSEQATAQMPSIPQAPRVPSVPPVAAAPLVPSSAAVFKAPGQSASSEEIAVGRLLVDRYELEAVLGEGGMATVYKAYDRELARHVGVKLLRPGAESDSLLTRFRHEIALARELTHRNIVRVYDIGAVGPRRFMTMELLSGHPLDALLHPLLPFKKAIGYLLQVCAGLRAAHDHGVVHRDIKPENIFVCDDGTVKLMDFGIARAPSGHGETQAGTIVGTPQYMAPEQIDNAACATAQSDLYALGIVMYEMFTGALPFDHDELLALLRLRAENKLTPPRALRPEIPESLEALILSLLLEDPQARPSTATDVGRALRSVANDVR